MSDHPIPFQILIGPRAFGDTYPVRAIAGQAERTSDLLLPPLLQQIAERLYHTGTQPAGDAATLGRALGQALFTPPLRDLLLATARRAAQNQRRLQIQLQIAPPELATLPWEWLTMGETRPWTPALRDDYALARISRGVPATAPLTVAGPLRVLAVAAPGEELQLAALEAALAEAVRAGTVELQLVNDATPATLEHGLAAGPVHILHCAAPVAYTTRGAPHLLLRRGMDLFGLAGLLADAKQLRLVTLTGPQGDAQLLNPTLPTLATALLSPTLPATIAFGGTLPARLAARFAAQCYLALAANQPIDLAVTAGRRALAEFEEGRGWGMPQLRIAPASTQLFIVKKGQQQTNRLWRGAAIGGAGLVLAGALALGLPALRGNVLAFMGSTAVSAPTATPALIAIATNQPTAELATATIPVEPTAMLATATPALPTPEPTAPPPPTAPPTPESAPAPASYATVLTRADDTLAAIAERMGSDAGAIARLNRLDMNEPLRADRPLVIPVYQAAEPGAGGLLIRRGNPAARNVALTFDIEIDAQTLYDILAILQARGLHGTFFLTGRWVMAFPDAARAIVSGGHEVCNHSLTHPSFSHIGLDGVMPELDKTDDIIQSTLGVTSRPCFRYPYGDSTQATTDILARDGYIAYHWSADDGAIDGWLNWAAQHGDEANGGILLMHGRRSTVAALPGWLDRVANLGFHATTLTETMR